MAKPKTITSWSISKLGLYNQCPRRARYKHVDKLKDPPGPHAQRGTDMHATLEAFVKGEAKGYHKDIKPTFKNIKGMLTRLRKNYKAGLVQVELEIAVDCEWRPTAYDYENPDVWARFKLDVVEEIGTAAVDVIDWKSGKVREGGSYDDQLNGYAVAVLSALPDVVTVKGALVFLDHDLVLRRPAGNMERSDLALQQSKWARAVKPMMTDTTFRPHPSTFCKWCPYSKAKGGPCAF